MTQTNSGPSVARNRGLDAAAGEWFASVDADDILDKHYFASVADVLDRDLDKVSSAVCTHLWMLDSQTGRANDTHALGEKFRHGDRLVDLRDEPSAFALSSTTFLRTAVLRENGLRFDPAVQPTFEDAHLIGRYLACFEAPVMAIASRARYYYRHRVALSTSLTQATWQKSENYTVVPRVGYLGMLTAIQARLGQTPLWAQYMILYSIMWYLSEEQSMTSKTAWVDTETATQFLQTLEQIMRYIDLSTIEDFPVTQLTWEMRQALLVRFKAYPQMPRVFNLPKRGRIARVTVFFHGDSPAFSIRSDDGTRAFDIEMQRSHVYFGEEWATQVTLAWDTGTTEPTSDSVWTDGVQTQLRHVIPPQRQSPTTSRFRFSSEQSDNGLDRVVDQIGRVLRIAPLATSRSMPRTVTESLSRQRDRLIHRHRIRMTKAVQRKTSNGRWPQYANAWVVMDRTNTADDNGEHLYRYLKFSRPEINAYFLLSKTSPHWNRLASEGFRLIEYGSRMATVIALHAAVRISSDIVPSCLYPVTQQDDDALPGIFVFLQHGVIVNDLSRWVNGKPIALMTTSTLAEWASIVGPGSPYSLTTKQVELLGLTRWDRLTTLRSAQVNTDTILVAPTWRADLERDLATCLNQDSRRQVFEESDYWQAWHKLLHSPALASSGKHIHLILHHRLNALVPELDLPPYVTRLTGDEINYQQELSRASLFITDFSSLAFDAAYVGLPVVYYQCDKDSFLTSHTSRPGYFSHERDGFGPVVYDAEAACVAIQNIMDAHYTTSEPYLSRIQNTFAFHDTDNCARTVAAIERKLKET